jgi:hypothetical protein
VIPYQDYTEAQNEELIDEIYSRQQYGFYEGISRLSRITCRCCPGSMFVSWTDIHYYRPRGALPCLICGRSPILMFYSRHGEEGDYRVIYWIYCQRCHKQEYGARKLEWHPVEVKTIQYTALQLIGKWNTMLRHKIACCNGWL